MLLVYETSSYREVLRLCRGSLEELSDFYSMCTSKVSKLGLALPAGKGKMRESLEKLAVFYNMCAKRKEQQRKQIPLKGAPFC
jgi:hypothetical protein